jgi:hypothetical protein
VFCKEIAINTIYKWGYRKRRRSTGAGTGAISAMKRERFIQKVREEYPEIPVPVQDTRTKT